MATAPAPNRSDFQPATPHAPAQDRVSKLGEYSGYSRRQYKKLEHQGFYLPMPDGVRLACDLYLPADRKSTDRLPTIFYKTRYIRSLELRGFLKPFIPHKTTNVRMHYVREFVKQGYAVMVVDARGSGASFGTRKMEFSPQEVADAGHVMDWLIQQPWSNGRVGSTGVSYVGTTALQMVANQHPALRAIFPRFGIFDLYADIGMPGGVPQTPFIDVWGDFTQAFDRNDFAPFGALAKLMVKGIRPVNTREGRQQLTQALEEHKENYDIISGIRGVTFRDELAPGGEVGFDDCSAHLHTEKIANSDTAIYWLSGWYDAAIVNSSCKGMMTFSDKSHLTIGPWDHGPIDKVQPGAKPKKVKFDMMAEMLRFFDAHLKDMPNGISEGPRVQYYTQIADRWRSADTWPPPEAQMEQLFLTADHRLTDDKPEAGCVRFQPPYTHRTGGNSRWNSQTLLYRNGGTHYTKRAEQAKELISFRMPIRKDVEIAGHPIARLNIAVDSTDATVFAYLEEETGNGHIRYITEGQFRALHRKPADNLPYKQAEPMHSFLEKDALPMTPGEPALLEFGLIPTSYLLRKGSTLLLTIAGSDLDHFALIDDRPTWIDLLVGGDQPSLVELPLVTR